MGHFWLLCILGMSSSPVEMSSRLVWYGKTRGSMVFEDKQTKGQRNDTQMTVPLSRFTQNT